MKGFKMMVSNIMKMKKVLALLEDNCATSASKCGLEHRRKNREEAIKLMRELLSK